MRWLETPCCASGTPEQEEFGIPAHFDPSTTGFSPLWGWVLHPMSKPGLFHGWKLIFGKKYLIFCDLTEMIFYAEQGRSGSVGVGCDSRAVVRRRIQIPTPVGEAATPFFITPALAVMPFGAT